MKEWFFLILANLNVRLKKYDCIRWKFLKLAGVNIKACEIRAPISLYGYGNLKNIQIGESVFINEGLRIAVGKEGSCKIASGCLIGPNVSIEGIAHNTFHSEEEGWGYKECNINIEKNVWLASGVIIVGSVTIGEGSIIAAGAVVNKDVPPFSLYGGVPAKFIRNLKENVS